MYIDCRERMGAPKGMGVSRDPFKSYSVRVCRMFDYVIPIVYFFMELFHSREERIISIKSGVLYSVLKTGYTFKKEARICRCPVLMGQITEYWPGSVLMGQITAGPNQLAQNESAPEANPCQVH